jgi:hypothetical protein
MTFNEYLTVLMPTIAILTAAGLAVIGWFAYLLIVSVREEIAQFDEWANRYQPPPEPPTQPPSIRP